MVINLAPWATTPADDTRLNRSTNIANTGTVLAALDKTKYGLFICTADGSGLIKDHLYLCNAAGDALIDVTATATHYHVDASTGGSIIGLFTANTTFMNLWLTKPTDLYEANWASPVFWNRAVTGTGSVENSTDGSSGERAIRLRPNGTSGSGSTVSYPHLKLNFAKNSFFSTKLRIETFSSLALHVGVGADDITAADSNTVKYQAEVCTVTNNNWWLRTASGSANSASDTGIAATANRVSIFMVHLPTLGTPEVDLYVDGVVLQKTSHIPTTSTTASNNLIKCSVKNSTGADRPLLFYGSRLAYYISDNWV